MVRKAVILSGGYGTRLMEETDTRPKPMVEVGGRPILWHIMKIYAAAGITEFVIPLGYKGHMIKQYFADYYLHASDLTVDLTSGTTTMLRHTAEPWKITLVDTGIETMTGGRLRRVREHLEGESFCMTYGDGVTDLDIRQAVAFHEAHGRHATVTAVPPPARFGSLELDGDRVTQFREKPLGDNNLINGGFFVLGPQVFRYLDGDSSIFERTPMEGLARDGELMAYKHMGFWYSMDTLKDKKHLEELWASGEAPWKVW